MFPNKEIQDYFLDLTSRRIEVDDLLLYGTYGTGKTSLANELPMLISSTVGPADCYQINGSARINPALFLRGLWNFCLYVPYNNLGLKFVIIDEIDGMPGNEKAALRSVMTETIKFVRFFITSNDLSKVDPAIQSRCEIVQFEHFEPEMRLDRVRDIVEAEGMHHLSDQDILDFLENQPDDNRKLFKALGKQVRRFRKINQIAAPIAPMLKKANTA